MIESEELAANNLTPLWEIFSSIVPNQPVAACDPIVWRYKNVRRLLLQMGSRISTADAERRVLILSNPGLKNPDGQGFSATRNLFAGLQLLLPGEAAPCHRHSQSALRFVLEGEGAYTSVDGERIDMHPGDLILTPSLAWHDHALPDPEVGDSAASPVIWLDGIDVPIVNYFGSTFLESYPADAPPLTVADKQADTAATSETHRVLVYPYAQALIQLNAMVTAGPCDPHTGYKLRYTNPQTGGCLLPTIACFLQQLPGAFKGESFRATDASINLVIKGEGRVWVGDTCLSWGPQDIFVVPNWSWCRFEADTTAQIFSYSDRQAQERLGLWREQTQVFD